MMRMAFISAGFGFCFFAAGTMMAGYPEWAWVPAILGGYYFGLAAGATTCHMAEP